MLHTVDNSSVLERSLQTKVYDLHSSSVALGMQDVFARRTHQILPVLAQVAGPAAASEYERRFVALMNEYRRLGMPRRLVDESARTYLAKVRCFSDDLRKFVETEHPIRVAVSASFAPAY